MKAALMKPVGTMGSKDILQFLCHHKLYETVHIYFHLGFRLCDHKLMDTYHFYV